MLKGLSKPFWKPVDFRDPITYLSQWPCANYKASAPQILFIHLDKRASSYWSIHDDVIKLKHFPRYWPFMRGIHRSQVNSPHKGQWRGAFIFSLIFTWTNGWVNNRYAVDLRRYLAHYDVTLIIFPVESIVSFRTKGLIYTITRLLLWYVTSSFVRSIYFVKR